MFGDYYTPNIVSGAPPTSMIGNQIDFFFHAGPQPTIGAGITVLLAAVPDRAHGLLHVDDPASFPGRCDRKTTIADSGRGFSTWSRLPAGLEPLGAAALSSRLHVGLHALVDRARTDRRSSSRSMRPGRAAFGKASRLAGTGAIRSTRSGTTPPSATPLVQSLKLASADVLIATPIGVLLAIGLARWTGPGSRPSNFLMLFPLVTPEIVMGVSLLLVFTHVFTFIGTGTDGADPRPRHVLDLLRRRDRPRAPFLDR